MVLTGKKKQRVFDTVTGKNCDSIQRQRHEIGDWSE
jgi:hypothetical protein